MLSVRIAIVNQLKSFLAASNSEEEAFEIHTNTYVTTCSLVSARKLAQRN